MLFHFGMLKAPSSDDDRFKLTNVNQHFPTYTSTEHCLLFLQPHPALLAASILLLLSRNDLACQPRLPASLAFCRVMLITWPLYSEYPSLTIGNTRPLVFHPFVVKVVLFPSMPEFNVQVSWYIIPIYPYVPWRKKLVYRPSSNDESPRPLVSRWFAVSCRYLVPHNVI